VSLRDHPTLGDPFRPVPRRHALNGHPSFGLGTGRASAHNRTLGDCHFSDHAWTLCDPFRLVPSRHHPERTHKLRCAGASRHHLTLGDGHLRYAIITSVITHIERGHTQASVWALAEPVPTTERCVIRSGRYPPERITQRAWK
jgi:hypothetical protein